MMEEVFYHDKNEQNSLSLRLEQCYTGVVHDVMRASGRSRFTLPRTAPHSARKNNGWTSLYHLRKTMPRDRSHETLVAWTGLLSKVLLDIFGSVNPMTVTLPTWESFLGDAPA